MQSQIKRRMWKSAIARVKRLRDEGRNFAPIVKKEPSKVVWREDEGGQADPDTFSDNEPGLEDTLKMVLRPRNDQLKRNQKREVLV